MTLTADLVARVHRAVAHPGPDPDFIPNTEEDHAVAVREMLASLPEGEHRSFGLRLRAWPTLWVEPSSTSDPRLRGALP
jgi:hypothetical protein